jgi:hypothetical protein
VILGIFAKFDGTLLKKTKNKHVLSVAIDASAIPLRTWLFFGIVVLILSL